MPAQVDTLSEDETTACGRCGVEIPADEAWSCSHCSRTLCVDCVEGDLCVECDEEKRIAEAEGSEDG